MVVGIGNVAVDVCRILAHTPERLAETDMAPYAEEALRESRVRNIYMLGRRGPAQAAFTVPEARELGRLDDCSTVTLPAEVELDPLSAKFAEQSDDRTLATKLDIIRSFAHPVDESKSRTLTIRFLTSPAAMEGDDEGRVARMKLVHNELVDDGRGGLRASATEFEEWLDVGLVFRSVGYYGVPLPDVPFREDWGIIPNDEGRVVDMDTGRQIAGHYVAGWIKAGVRPGVDWDQPAGCQGNRDASGGGRGRGQALVSRTSASRAGGRGNPESAVAGGDLAGLAEAGCPGDGARRGTGTPPREVHFRGGDAGNRAGGRAHNQVVAFCHQFALRMDGQREWHGHLSFRPTSYRRRSFRHCPSPISNHTLCPAQPR